MIQPGSKNWIDKYFLLIDNAILDIKDILSLDNLDNDSILHSTYFKTGITLGFSGEMLLYTNKEISEQWTNEEQSYFLLFEGLLLIYYSERKIMVKEDFIQTLLSFYQQYEPKHSLNVLKLLFKESESVKLEGILRKRVHAKQTITNRLWASYMHNGLLYLDILAFRSFLKHNLKLSESRHDFVLATLYTLGVMALIDDVVDDDEYTVINNFIDSANIDTDQKENFLYRLQSKFLSIKDIKIPSVAGGLYKRYLLDMAILTIYSDLAFTGEEMKCLEELCEHIGLPKDQLKHSIIVIERFIMQNNDKISFLNDKNAYEQMFDNFSHRWIKILGRNKDKFVEELNDSKELISLVKKSRSEELNAEEKEKVKEQFKDLAKTLPSLAIFLLPGGAVLLPLILKIVPNLVPSAFKNQNEEGF